jgi:AcrR family transcriptional regulator
MSRPRSLPDAEIFTKVLAALGDGGEKALTFGVIARLTGLAPATLAQRYGSVDGMVRAALLAEWGRLSQAVSDAEAEALVSAKGAQALLKHLPLPTIQVLALSLKDEGLATAAAHWRDLVETALATRRGGGAKGREAAALIFAAWQGRVLWEAAGGKSFRLAEMLKALP